MISGMIFILEPSVSVIALSIFCSIEPSLLGVIEAFAVSTWNAVMSVERFSICSFMMLCFSANIWMMFGY